MPGVPGQPHGHPYICEDVLCCWGVLQEGENSGIILPEENCCIARGGRRLSPQEGKSKLGTGDVGDELIGETEVLKSFA